MSSFPRLLVITSCTGAKKYQPENPLILKDFQNLELLKKRTEALQSYASPAGELYTGQQHRFLIEGISLLRSQWGKNVIDIKIVSAGYGLLSEDDQIVPYEVTFNNLKSQELSRWAEHLNLHQNYESAIANYDLVFILLGEKYLRALSLPVVTQRNQTFIFLASSSSRKYIAQKGDSKIHVMELSNQEAKNYGCALISLKGFLFKQICEQVLENHDLLINLYEQPQKFQDLLSPKEQKIQLELGLNIPVDTKILKNTVTKTKNVSFLEISKTPIAPNAALGMQYFIPEWDDHVDPSYDFFNDILTPGRDTYEDEVYAHQIYDSPNYDGILVSKVVVEASKKKKKKIEEIGIHNFIRFYGEVMGDCGAFGYIQEDVPPYETEEILDYYENLGFNYGVSIDHLIVGGFAEPGIRERRYQLTIDNAQDFLDRHKSGNYTFTPIGAAQGWNPETYAESVKAYIDMGYDYIAIGGVARTPTKQIIEILKAVKPHLKENIRLHLFGVARIDAIPIFRHLGVTSFDSASPLRRAWLGSGKNYDTLWGDSYSAVRVPPVNKHGVRVKRLLEANVADKQTLETLESNTLNALREFEKGNFDLEEALQTILKYDSLLELPRDGVVNEKAQVKRTAQHEVMYRQILEDKPWQKCDCKICQELGIEVMIFRGNDRNRRRGFHNTFVFYKRFKEILSKLNKGEVLT